MTMINKNIIHPRISGRPLAEWGAELLFYEVGPCEYRNGYLKAPGKIFPVRLTPSIGLREITLTVDFSAEHPRETASAISDFTDVLQDSPDILLPDGFYYRCEYDAASPPERKAPWIEQVSFRLYGVRHDPVEKTTLTNNGTIKAKGNIETAMIVTLTPLAGVSVMQFMGITINSSRPVTIDGVYTTIKDSLGNNVFGDTDMTEWPKLKPGKNVITMNGVESAAISYYPLWK